MARKGAQERLGALDRLAAALEQAGKATIRAYAKKHELVLRHHRKPWVFVAKSGEKVAMLPGYFAIVDGVLHDLRVAL